MSIAEAEPDGTPAHPFLSIIIPSYNDDERLRQCLQLIAAQDYPGDHEVIVVDNGSKTLPEVGPGVTLIVEPKPGSYNARNAGLQIARGGVIVFTDSDCAPSPHWLSAGVKALLADEAIGLVGGRIQIRPMSSADPSLTELLETALAFPQENYITVGHYAATANVFTRRSVIDRVGPFNGALRSGGDADWGQRVHAAGYRLAYAPDAVVDHPARVSYDEIYRKLLRTVGGERDRKPGWKHALQFSARRMVPPRSAFRQAFALKDVPMTRRAAVAAYCMYLNWVRAGYRLKLQITKQQSVR